MSNNNESNEDENRKRKNNEINCSDDEASTALTKLPIIFRTCKECDLFCAKFFLSPYREVEMIRTNEQYDYRHFTDVLDPTKQLPPNDMYEYANGETGKWNSEMSLVGAGNDNCTVCQRFAFLCGMHHQSNRKEGGVGGDVQNNNEGQGKHFQLLSNPTFLEKNFKDLLFSRGDDGDEHCKEVSTINLVLTYGCNKNVPECYVLARNKGLADIEAMVGESFQVYKFIPLETNNQGYTFRDPFALPPPQSNDDEQVDDENGNVEVENNQTPNNDLVEQPDDANDEALVDAPMVGNAANIPPPNDDDDDDEEEGQGGLWVDEDDDSIPFAVLELSRDADDAKHFYLTPEQWLQLRIHPGISRCVRCPNVMTVLTYHNCHKRHIDVSEILESIESI